MKNQTVTLSIMVMTSYGMLHYLKILPNANYWELLGYEAVLQLLDCRHTKHFKTKTAELIIYEPAGTDKEIDDYNLLYFMFLDITNNEKVEDAFADLNGKFWQTFITEEETKFAKHLLSRQTMAEIADGNDLSEKSMGGRMTELFKIIKIKYPDFRKTTRENFRKLAIKHKALVIISAKGNE